MHSHSDIIPLPHMGSNRFHKRIPMPENCLGCKEGILHTDPGRNNSNCRICDEELEDTYLEHGGRIEKYPSIKLHSWKGAGKFPHVQNEYSFRIHDHLESEHHLPIRRLFRKHNGEYVWDNTGEFVLSDSTGFPLEETVEESFKRFTETNLDYGGENCKCPYCVGGELLDIYEHTINEYYSKSNLT